MNEKKKKIFIIIGVVAALVTIFLIYWNATAYDRYIKGEKNYILEEISDYRSGESSYLSFWLDSSALEDPSFIDFLSAQAFDMVDNGEYSALDEFLDQLEEQEVYISGIRDAITNSFESADTLEDAFKIKEKMQYREYYNTKLIFSRDSTLIVSYIETNGVEEITTTPGTGFYADKKDSSSRRTIGLSNSPLYDAERKTYRGDFAIEREYGVKLNSYYEETPYSYTKCFFRDNRINFSPDSGECIYSGDYLFCFGSNGTLIAYAKIYKK